MKVHLVGGFLGSGKTTAISNACKLLLQENITTSVITNDQGNYLVDSQFIQSLNIPNTEVSGGCFCCNYNQFDAQINELKQNYNPSVIFAESVGSCTDLVATVLKPLLKFRGKEIEQLTFSSFVDAQLFYPYLQGKTLPFSMETNYIWEKQIEEAENLIVNKVDLLTDQELEKVKRLAYDAFPRKQLIFQNSLDFGSIWIWLGKLSDTKKNREYKSIQIDYNKYAVGEANLAWLDEEIEIKTENDSAVKITFEFIEKLTKRIKNLNIPIGHLKYLVSVNDKYYKISYTTISEDKIKIPDDLNKSNTAHLLVNSRIHATPKELRSIFIKTIDELKADKKITVAEKHLSYFQPGIPEPTHRID